MNYLIIKNSSYLQDLDSQNSYISQNKYFEVYASLAGQMCICQILWFPSFSFSNAFDNEIAICKGVMVDEIISVGTRSVYHPWR